MTEFLVKHNGEQHDVGRFLKFHPGGSNTIRNYEGCNITPQLKTHAPSAFELLKDYRIRNEKKDEDVEDLERLVNWEKPMVRQVGSLGENYNKWIMSPVDRHLRLFHYDLLESMTITPWFVVPLVWIPFSAYLVYSGYHRLISIEPYGDYNTLTIVYIIVISTVMGFFLWPLIEYSIHRWLFHLTPPPDSPVLITVHFAIHGLHHKVPFDSQRLLFPPAATAVVVSILYGLLRLAFPSWMTCFLVCGGILGYVTYDLIHFYLHYGSPAPGTYLYNMKRYHNQHHFTDHNIGFGISSPLWDRIFGTFIHLKELKYHLKW